MSDRTAVRRYAAEGALIVGSILVAFAIDAAWNARQERIEEERILASLQSEMEANRRSLQERTAWHRDVEGAIRALLAAAAASRPEISEDSVDVLMGKASWFNNGSTFEMSAVDAVVLGGRLPIVSDAALRQRIAGWSRLVMRVTRTEAQDYDTFSDVWMPYLRSHAYLPQVHNAIDVQPGGVGENYIPEVPVTARPTSHLQLLADRSFQNVLLHRLWVEGDILEEYRKVMPSLDSLSEALDASLRGT